MKKVVFICSIIGHIESFHLPTLKMFKENGYKTYVISKGTMDSKYIDVCIDIPFDRFPLTFENFKNYFKIKKIFKNENFDIISCHTPAASVIARLAARKMKSYVVYMAHGFHFFKGGDFFTNFVYKNIEKMMAHFTDTIITINNEDYNAAKQFRLRNKGSVYYVPGVGVDLSYFNSIKGNKSDLLDVLGLPKDSFLLISIGELNKNKNHIVILETLNELKNLNISYIMCGSGDRAKEYQEYIQNNDLKNVRLLGYRKDIAYLLKCSDLMIFPSFREGLPVSVMEAMACGVPVIASDIRGCKDIVDDGVNGYLVKPQDSASIAILIKKLIENKTLKDNISKESLNKIKNYDINIILKQLFTIYFDRRK